MTGLSPLARGTRCGQPCGSAHGWFIPAGAGNTHSPFESMLNRAVYPRWRGEHALKVKRSESDIGLSPLARGTRQQLERVSPVRRFIPAGAGNTGQPGLLRECRAVYPRWRGEHLQTSFKPFFICGLSPLARGTPLTDAIKKALSRFIPAGAGNTGLSAAEPPTPPVYPRWRGEHNSPFGY